jgi:hypothetical protein
LFPKRKSLTGWTKSRSTTASFTYRLNQEQIYKFLAPMLKCVAQGALAKIVFMVNLKE